MKTMLKMTMAAAVSLVALEASAGGFAVREQSTTAQGTSFAGAATSAAGLSSMYWNPAAVTSMPGINFESHAALILAFGKLTPTIGSGPLTLNRPDTGNIAQPAVVPASYSAHQINERLFVGMSVNSPFGLVTKTEPYSAAQFYGRTSKAFNVVVTPTVGYIVNDWLSVAAGIQVGYIDVRLTQSTFGAPLPGGVPTAFGPTAPTAILKGDAWGVGYTLGATIKPLAGTEIGIGFRSSVHYGLEGSLATPTSYRPIKASLNTPEIITVGLKQRITDRFDLLAGYEWTNWSRVKSPVVSDRNTGAAVTSLHFRYKDSWMVSLGGEYKYSDVLTLRAGMAYEKSPVTDAVRSVRITDNDRVWASLGGTYRWNNKLSFDLAYTHIWVKDPNVAIVPGNPHYNALLGPASALVANGKAHVDIISVGLRYRWDEPARPVASGPIITKY